MTLTTEQQKKVEENLGLVGKVIKDKVHGLTSVSIYTLSLIHISEPTRPY